MKLRFRFANQVVGVFVLLALSLTIALIILMGANQRWFKKNFVYQAEFHTASDLTVGMPISFRGFEIGKVTDIALTEDNVVLVTFFIQEEYIDKLNRDSLIQLISSPLGGGQIVLQQGREVTPPPPEGSTIPIYESKQGIRLREDNNVIVVRNTDPIAQALGQIDPILLNVDRVLTGLVGVTNEIELALQGQSDGPVSGTLNGLDQAVTQLQDMIADVGTVVRDTTNQINELLADVGTITENLDDITRNIEVTTEALRDPTGLVPMLLDPKGSIATILDDDNQLFDEITRIIGSLDSSISSLQNAIGDVQDFTGYLNTTQPQISSLLEEGRQALTTGQDVLEGLRNNPLLRGGIPDALEQPTTFRSIRDGEF